MADNDSRNIENMFELLGSTKIRHESRSPAENVPQVTAHEISLGPRRTDQILKGLMAWCAFCVRIVSELQLKSCDVAAA
jgi:hypothetical protein